MTTSLVFSPEFGALPSGAYRVRRSGADGQARRRFAVSIGKAIFDITVRESDAEGVELLADHF
jgi:hypothetical protein